MDIDVSEMTRETPAECCVPLTGNEMSDDEVAATASVFKALGDPNRVRIVNLLAASGDPVCVCNLTPQLELSQPTVSFHLKKLVEAGLLERQQRGVWAYYSVNREALGRLETLFRMQDAEMQEARA
jgi:ArsR family transcriptional regulator, arsenate/arsenite/antimonite-responsive transcriptional repressor